MKKQLFHVVPAVTYASIWFSGRVFSFVIQVLAWLSGVVRFLIVNLGVALMKLVDNEEYEAIQAKMQLESQQAELDLLASVSKLKEHAMEIGDWTEEHTEALKAIGNALLNECSWDKEHVHRYLREVVESIPGLHYETGEDEDDLLY
jgi:hypothetical protein